MNISLRVCIYILIGLTALFSDVQAAPQVSLHGFARLDAQYMDKIPRLQPSIVYPLAIAVPFNNEEKYHHSQTLLDVRYSRAQLTAVDTICSADMFGIIECDFYPRDNATAQFANTFPLNDSSDLANPHRIRLRLAYGRLDTHGFFAIAGQDWSKFLNIDIGVPPVIDINGWAGWADIRQPQLAIGYNYHVSCQMGYLSALASVERRTLYRSEIERFIFPSIDDDASIGFKWPLVVAKIGWYGFRPLEIEIAAMTGQNRIIREVGGDPFQKQGWGYQATAQSHFYKVTLFGHYQFLNGLNRYSNLDYPDVAFTTIEGFALHNIRSYGWYAGASYDVLPTTALSTIVGWTRAHSVPLSLFSASTLSRVISYQIDAVHSFLSNWEIGIEFKKWETWKFDRIKGSLFMASGEVSYYF